MLTLNYQDPFVIDTSPYLFLYNIILIQRNFRAMDLNHLFYIIVVWCFEDEKYSSSDTTCNLCGWKNRKLLWALHHQGRFLLNNNFHDMSYLMRQKKLIPNICRCFYQFKRYFSRRTVYLLKDIFNHFRHPAWMFEKSY